MICFFFYKMMAIFILVSLPAVFSGRSELCDDTKNGCEGDYFHFGAPSCKLMGWKMLMIQSSLVCNVQLFVI